MAGKQLSLILEKYQILQNNLDKKILNQQSQYWEKNFLSKPEMFGLKPSKAALSALQIFRKENIKEIRWIATYIL